MSDGLRKLIAKIDAAVTLEDPGAIARGVKAALEDAIGTRSIVLPERFHRVRAEGYARRLLHRNDRLGYTAVVMTWGPGQGTPLHDHAGIWCVEGVLEGRMDVTQFDLVEEADDDCRFVAKGSVRAAVGSAGCLIPPFEYHVLANAVDTPSLTLHVYGGEMTTCHVFEPVPGSTHDGFQDARGSDASRRYVRRARALTYDD